MKLINKLMSADTALVIKEDKAVFESLLAKVAEEVSNTSSLLTKSVADRDEQYREMTNRFGQSEKATEETRAQIKESADHYAAMVKNVQDLTSTMDALTKERDAPIHSSAGDLKDADRQAAINLQKTRFVSKGNSAEDFVEDTANLVDARIYRSVANKLAKAGPITREEIVKGFSAIERKTFEASGMDTSFFSPEMLGLEIDCDIVCASMIDLYDQLSVSKSSFMATKIKDYGQLGSYTCPASCDYEQGEAGNISHELSKTYDYRGSFCLQRDTVAEANYAILPFMIRAAQRGYNISRNQALITGDGKNEARGWLSSGAFAKLKTGGLKFTAQDFRRFISTAPIEYGKVTATMHQNMLGYLASSIDNSGRFMFADGSMIFSPDTVSDFIRISNCLPDATEGNTVGDITAPFTAGDFLVAAGNWKEAYSAVTKSPMSMEQYVGKSSKWCVQYQFGAQDGGFVKCANAVRQLVVGA